MVYNTQSIRNSYKLLIEKSYLLPEHFVLSLQACTLTLNSCFKVYDYLGQKWLDDILQHLTQSTIFQTNKEPRLRRVSFQSQHMQCMPQKHQVLLLLVNRAEETMLSQLVTWQHNIKLQLHKTIILPPS